MLHALWLLLHGFWLMLHGFWLLLHGCRVVADCSLAFATRVLSYLCSMTSTTGCASCWRSIRASRTLPRCTYTPQPVAATASPRSTTRPPRASGAVCRQLAQLPLRLRAKWGKRHFHPLVSAQPTPFLFRCHYRPVHARLLTRHRTTLEVVTRKMCRGHLSGRPAATDSH